MIDNCLWGGSIPESSLDTFLLNYTGCLGYSDVKPDEDALAWTEEAVGVGTAEASNGLLAFTVAVDDDQFDYLYAVDIGLSVGYMVEALVRVTAGSAVADKGAALQVADGAYRQTLWLRATGLNIATEADVPLDLTRWTLIQFIAEGTSCAVLADGVVLQAATVSSATTDYEVLFGCPGSGAATVEFDFVRVRLLGADESVPTS